MGEALTLHLLVRARPDGRDVEPPAAREGTTLARRPLRANQIVIDEKEVVPVRITDRLDGHAPVIVTYLDSCCPELVDASGHLAPVEGEEEPPATCAKTVPIEDQLGSTAIDLQRHGRSTLLVAPVLDEPEARVEASAASQSVTKKTGRAYQRSTLLDIRLPTNALARSGER